MTAKHHQPVRNLRPFEVTISTLDGAAVAERISIVVPMDWDEDIGEWTLPPEAERLIEARKIRHMGLSREC